MMCAALERCQRQYCQKQQNAGGGGGKKAREDRSEGTCRTREDGSEGKTTKTVQKVGRHGGLDRSGKESSQKDEQRMAVAAER